MENPTSIKQLIQGMQVKDMELHEGVVISADPLQIKLVNNEKMVLDKDILTVPMHLVDYKTKISVSPASGATLTSTTKGAGSHNHTVSGVGSTSTEPDHVHELDKFQLTQADVTMHNGLKKDEIVMMLSYNNGKMYYILDRVVK